MNTPKSAIIIPVLLITLGIGWLLAALGVAPEVDWLWILSLAVVGVLMFAIWGFDKLTVVAGPWFILASVLSLLRQTGRLEQDIEVPILVIAMGVLMLIARLSFVRLPSWYVAAAEAESQKSSDD